MVFVSVTNTKLRFAYILYVFAYALADSVIQAGEIELHVPVSTHFRIRNINIGFPIDNIVRTRGVSFPA